MKNAPPILHECVLDVFNFVDIYRRTIMADNVKETIQDAGKAVSDTAKKAAANVKAGANTVAEKAADATKAVGNAVKKAGKSMENKSGT